MKIYLASKSPRRKSLLAQMGVTCDVLSIETPEQVYPNETPEAFSLRVVQEKLDAAWDKISLNKLRMMPVLCADTEVILGEDILGKAANQADAFDMLKKLSGRTHRVITSVGMKYLNFKKIHLTTTFVTFETIPDSAIQYYLSTGDYQDKSGSYGIQSYIGQYISRIEGCFYAVMGLPLYTVREMLEDNQLKKLLESTF